jgi:hypothetical protein
MSLFIGLLLDLSVPALRLQCIFLWRLISNLDRFLTIRETVCILNTWTASGGVTL